jgi:hypothetical protein
MENFNWIALLIAMVGSGGIFVAVREIVGVVTLARQGVSGREDRRRADIVSQRDWALSERDKAIAEKEAADKIADAAIIRFEQERDRRIRVEENERGRRRVLEDELTRANRQIVNAGLEPRPWPEFEDTENPLRN